MTMRRHDKRGWLLGALGALAAVSWLLAKRTGDTFVGKLVVVTGGSRGLGLNLAREFARRGARVVICARDADELERAARTLAHEGLEVYPQVCDVSVRAAAEKMVAEIEAQHGAVDVLVNNAGLLYFGPATAMTHLDLRTAMDTNFWGAVHTIEAVLPTMLARRDGRIVNICSVGGVSPVPHMLPYSASKAALNGYSLGLNYDLAREGISVTTVHPFVMRTGGPINGTYRGSARRGLYQALAFADSHLLFSVSPQRVARKVVRAAANRETIVFIGWRTRLVAAMQGMLPRPLAAVYRSVARTLLPPSSTRIGETGMHIASELDGKARDVVERSRAKNNQPEIADVEPPPLLGTPVVADVVRLPGS
ncbi:MAG TPA: SDR family oxidoreductase [Nannocystaceae bacterium]|nr:SDR family oxidoreductase [Nannocystaceae bacterium]